MLTNNLEMEVIGSNTLLKIIIGLVAMALLSSVAFADNDSAKNALAKAQYMLRQTTAEKSELEKQIGVQKATIDSLEKQIALLKRESQATRSESGAQVEAIGQLKDNNQKLHEKMNAEASKANQLNEVNQQLQERLETQIHNFDVCYDNNKKLYQVNQELLGKYKDKGFLATLSQKEPVTSLGLVKVENLIQDYQYQMDSLTVKLVPNDKPTN